jgi:hypothetical protein
MTHPSQQQVRTGTWEARGIQRWSVGTLGGIDVTISLVLLNPIA